MDGIDYKILTLLHNNGRMTVKEISSRVALTSPAVAERIRRMERTGIIAGYTVRLNPELTRKHIHALVSILVTPKDRPDFQKLLKTQAGVEKCYQVTGTYSHMVKASCPDVAALENLLNKLQKYGQTNTQIILAEEQGELLPMLPEEAD